MSYSPITGLVYLPLHDPKERPLTARRVSGGRKTISLGSAQPIGPLVCHRTNRDQWRGPFYRGQPGLSRPGHRRVRGLRGRQRTQSLVHQNRLGDSLRAGKLCRPGRAVHPGPGWLGLRLQTVQPWQFDGDSGSQERTGAAAGLQTGREDAFPRRDRADTAGSKTARSDLQQGNDPNGCGAFRRSTFALTVTAPARMAAAPSPKMGRFPICVICPRNLIAYGMQPF